MKVNYSYIESLIETAEKHEVEEYQFYRDRGRKLTIKQLELISKEFNVKNVCFFKNEKENFNYRGA